MWSVINVLSLISALHTVTDVEIVSRKEWGARPPVTTTNLTLPVPKVFIHHTVMSPCTDKVSCERSVRLIQDFHMDDRGWWDIGYNFLIGGDGRVYEGRGWDIQGAQVKHYNEISIGIAFIGDFTKILPVDKAIEAAHELILMGLKKGKISSEYKLHGHRDANNLTSCPGDRLYPTLRTWPHYSPDVDVK